MCGLAGIFDLDAARDVDRAALRRITTALGHRGPDGDGFHVEPGVGLGHRRLSIIDPEGGHQPMYNEDESVAIVFNGCIYNHAELRPELEALGHVFASRCDTEAIIHAWESWGPDCLDRLSGMFAFALWDRNRQVLFLARDRLGKKPLHYAVLPDGRFAFASELGALMLLPEIDRAISPTAVDDFFAYGFIPDPQTIYRNVRKLPAAHSLLLRRGSREIAPRRYWQVRFAPEAVSEAEAMPELLRRFTHCVESRLIADVPLGAFLSGGVDSSAVVALAAGLRDGPLSTCTIGFPGDSDERPYAEMVARRYRTAHRAEEGAIDYIAAARDQAAVFGEPFGDSSSVPTHQVCALARREVTVAISGDGGDEVFAGYRRYRWHRLIDGVRSYLPAPVRRRVVGELARIYPKLDRAPQWLRAKYTLTELSLDSALGYYRMLCKVQSDRRRGLFAPGFAAGLDGHDPAAQVAALMGEAGVEDPVSQAQFVDLNHYLVGDILTKVDRASMANSLEVRAPLLDHELVQWAATLPSSLKLRGQEGKHVLKRAMEGHLPREILYRTKQGFATSLAGQMRAGAGRVRERLLGDAMLDSGLFDPSAVGRLVDEHAGGRFDRSGALWLLLVFEGFLAAADPAARGRSGTEREGVPVAA